MTANYDEQLSVIGKRIRDLRTSLELRQEDIATQVGLTRPSIANIEAGRQDTTLTTVLAIAKALQVPVVRLLNEEYDPLPDQLRIFAVRYRAFEARLIAVQRLLGEPIQIDVNPEAE